MNTHRIYIMEDESSLEKSAVIEKLEKLGISVIDTEYIFGGGARFSYHLVAECADRRTSSNVHVMLEHLDHGGEIVHSAGPVDEQSKYPER